MSSELVSICIPAYNNEKVIERTLKALVNQTYQNIEIIVVDDCSRDRTCDVVNSLNDDRIKLFQNENNLGMSGNWNMCVSKANGEFVKLICADDILEPDSIEKEVKCISENQNIVMTINDSKMINDSDEEVGTFPRYHKKGIINGKTLAQKSLIVSNYFGMPSAVLMRKSVFDKVGGFDYAYHYILDFDLWIRIALEGDVYVMPEKLNHFRLRSDSNTGNVFTKDGKRYYNEHKYLVNKYKDRCGLNGMEVAISLLSRKIRNLGYAFFLKIKGIV